MWMESRLDQVDDAIQNATLFFCTSPSLLFVSELPLQFRAHLNVKIYTLFTDSHPSATMYTYGSHLHPRYVLEHSLEVYTYTPVLTVYKEKAVFLSHIMHHAPHTGE